MNIKINYQNPCFFATIGLLLTVLWGLTGYYILGPLYIIMSFLFYLALFLLGILFQLPDAKFIPSIYIFILGSDLISRLILRFDDSSSELFFYCLILFILELMVLNLKKIIMDAKEHGWSKKRKWQKIGISLLLPGMVLLVYYLIISQLFIVEDVN